MGRLSFGGPDALALIQHLYTNNAATLQDGQVRYGLVCNEQGGIRDDVLVYKWPYGYAMVVNASNRPKIVAWLEEHKGGPQRTDHGSNDANGHDRRARAESVGTGRGVDRCGPWQTRLLLRRADALPGSTVRRQPHRLQPARTALSS